MTVMGFEGVAVQIAFDGIDVYETEEGDITVRDGPTVGRSTSPAAKRSGDPMTI